MGVLSGSSAERGRFAAGPEKSAARSLYSGTSPIARTRELALESTDQLRDFIYRGNIAGIVHTTVDGRMLDCNDALVRMLGYSSREELQRRSRTAALLRTGGTRAAAASRQCLARSAGIRSLLSGVATIPSAGPCINIRLLDPQPGQVGGTLVSTVDRHYRTQAMGRNAPAKPAKVHRLHAPSSRHGIHQRSDREIRLLQRSLLGAVPASAPKRSSGKSMKKSGLRRTRRAIANRTLPSLPAAVRWSLSSPPPIRMVSIPG